MSNQPEDCSKDLQDHTSEASSDGIAKHNANAVTDESLRELAHIGPKSVKVCYLLCIFFGVLGLHKIYLNQTKKAGLYIVLLLLGGVGYITWLILGVFLLQDLFSIPIQVRVYNEELPAKLDRHKHGS